MDKLPANLRSFSQLQIEFKKVLLSFFAHKDFKLSFCRVGNGSKTLLAFNGFGQTAQELAASFSETVLAEQFTIYCLDFFFHGESSYPVNRIEKDVLRKDEYLDMMNAFLVGQKIDGFSLYGFSLGGKICLIIYERFFEKIDHLFLVASDGLVKHHWYHVIIRVGFLRCVYKHIIHQPHWFIKFLDTLSRAKILSQRVIYFLKSQLSTEENRKRIYKVWMVMRCLEPSKRNIRKIEQHSNIVFFMGKRDAVIPYKRAFYFQKRCRLMDSKVFVLPYGHNLHFNTPFQKICKHIGEEL